MSSPPYPTPWEQPQVELTVEQQIQNQWTLHEGLCCLPVALTAADEAAGKSPVVFGRLHPPFRQKTVLFQSRKSNGPPVLPSPTDSGAFVFMGGSVSIPTPQMNQTAIFYDWQGAAEYTFIENVPSDPADGFVLTTAPWQYQTQVEAAQFAGGTPTPPQGAIAQAGLDAKVGWFLSQNYLNTDGAWDYPNCSYYPGKLLNAEIVNGATLPVG